MKLWRVFADTVAIAVLVLVFSGLLYDFVDTLHNPVWWRQVIAMSAMGLIIVWGYAIVHEAKK